MAEAVVSFAIQRLGELLVAEAKFLYGVGSQIEEIQAELMRMQSFLKDADSRQGEDERVRNWVREIRRLAYRVEDVLETFTFKVAARRRGGIKNILTRLACILSEGIALHKAGKEIETIHSRISALTRSLQTYGLKDLNEGEGSSSTHENHRWKRLSHSEYVEVDFVGMEEDLNKLVSYLVDGDKQCHVVSINGMGGSGKTTLAQKIYKSRDVRRHFDAFAWVCITQKCQTRNTLRDILKGLVPELKDDIIKMADGELLEQIYKVQHDRKCLVVLDDIWSMDAWDSLRRAFPTGKTASKILLTTRSIDVAEHVDPDGCHHQLQLLDANKSWELFQKKVFSTKGDTNFQVNLKMEKLGRQMVKRCKGLPLAISALGGVLKGKNTTREWEMVHQNIMSYLQRGKGIGKDYGEVQQVLALSYDDLPYQLKPCFLYLGNFPEDSKIEVETLYQLWIAEGMILSKDQGEEETMMEVAERYLGELVQRSMVEIELKELPTIKRFKSCNLHDLMRDLCLLKVKEESFLKLIDCLHGNTDKPIKSSKIGDIPRLTIYLSGEDVNKYVAPQKETTQHIRSLLLYITGEHEQSMPRVMKSQFSSLKMLRILAIEGLVPKVPAGNIKDGFCILLDHFKLPKAIGNLTLLRYLSLQDSCFFTLPSSICNLENLQTLNLQLREIAYIPGGMLMKMVQLRHLYLPKETSIIFQRSKLRLAGLNSLEILENFNPSWCDVKDLIKLTNLRKLTALVREKFEDLVEIMKRINVASYPNRLRHTCLDIYGCNFCSEEGLSLIRQLLCCGSLCHLCIWGQVELPKHGYQSFSANLSKLTLKYSNLEEDSMAVLGKLPNLRVLQFLKGSYVGKEMICSANGFPQLRRLVLSSMKNLEKWVVEDGAMPNLVRLRIWSCEKLEMMPNGLRSITTLQELEIGCMPDAFQKRVRVIDGREGEDFDKVRNVLSITFRG